MLEKDKEKQKYENNTQIDMKLLNTFSIKHSKYLQLFNNSVNCRLSLDTVKINASNVYNLDKTTSIIKYDKKIAHLQEENKPFSRNQKQYLLFI